MLQVSGITLLQVETFNYLGLVFASDGRRNKEIHTRIGTANAVLCEIYRSAAAKRELSNTTKLSAFNLFFVRSTPIAVLKEYKRQKWDFRDESQCNTSRQSVQL